MAETTNRITVTRTTVPAMTLVALRGTVPTYFDEPLLWQRMTPALVAQGVTAAGPWGVIEHDDGYTERDVDLSIFMHVAPGTRVEAPLEILELPERDCLVARVLGSHKQISKAHDLINDRRAADGLSLRGDGTLASKAFNLYLATPDQVSEDELVTEVYEPLA